MKTLLLAAGQSKRFWPLAEKSLFPLCGRPLISHQIERLRAGGCRDITIIVGAHNRKAIRRLHPELKLIEQKDLALGMQGALLSALPRCKKEPVLIVSGNDVVDPTAIRDVLAAVSAGADGAILAQRMKRYFPGGYLSVKGKRITGIVEKPGEGNEPSSLVNIVVHAHASAADLLAALKAATSKRDDGYEQALASLFAEKKYLAVPYTGPWQPVKYPWHLLPLLELLLRDITAPKVSTAARIHPTAVIDGPVVIEDGARLLPHATVVGPAYIGKNAIVGTGGLVRLSSIGDRSIVGFATEVKGSALAEDVWTHMTYLGDTVCGSNVSFGGGTVTGNLRLDEGEITSPVDGKAIATGLTKFGSVFGEGCRIGIRVGTNPGVKVGPGTFVAGGAYLTSDVPARSFVTMKGGEPHVRANRAAAPEAAEREKYRRKV